MGLEQQDNPLHPRKLSGRTFVTIDVLNRWNTRKCEMETYGKNFSILMMGEEHESWHHPGEQIGIISRLKPEYVLHEGMGAYLYDGKTQQLILHEARAIDSIDENPLASIPTQIYYNVQQLKYKLVGCDLTHAECDQIALRDYPELFYYYKKYGLVNRRGIHPDELYRIRSDETILRLRDNQMAQTMLFYQRLSRKPIVAIVGAGHARRIHKNGLLKRHGIGYAHVDQFSGRGFFA